ncbi:GATA zinc finger domain-containing protein 14-like [Nasonia vitripennis]|uniref:Uncharacterized protein n=1 Tax=Nasonia vitripennis TaxID=7425 RepID=A0A7M7R428_NASVI|nr:GATA zinc finger domain-containing protein 14-like [Nasonia vitripennis]
MRQGATVGDFYDELNVLLSSAKNALKEEKGEENIDKMMEPLEIPKNLQEAYEEAVPLESRLEARIIPDSRPRITRNYYNGQNSYNNGYGNEGGYNNRGHEGYRSQNKYDERNHREQNYVGYVNEQEDYVGYVNQPEQRERSNNYGRNNYYQNNYNRNSYQRGNSNYNNYGRGGYQRGYNNSNRQGGSNWPSWNRNNGQGNQRQIFNHENGCHEDYQPSGPDRRENYNNYPNNWRGGNGRNYQQNENERENLNSQGARHGERMTSQERNQSQRQQQDPDQHKYQQQMQNYNQGKQNPIQNSQNNYGPQRAPVMTILTKQPEFQECVQPTARDLKSLIGKMMNQQQ